MSDRGPEHQGPGFSCPEELAEWVPDTRMCTPFQCPPKLSTPRYSSPTSPLSPAETEELIRCIEAANDLLRTLGNPRDPHNTEALRVRFRSMRGLLVRVVVECHHVQKSVVGCLKDAGKDFLHLDQVGEELFIPFERICSVSINDTGEIHLGHHQELANIDPALRRNLILRFGETVSGNPELIQIFFGLRLHQRLLSFTGCRVRVERESCGGEPLVGLLCGVEGPEHPRIEVQVENRLEFVHLHDLCLISVGALIEPPAKDEPEHPEPEHPEPEHPEPEHPEPEHPEPPHPEQPQG